MQSGHPGTLYVVLMAFASESKDYRCFKCRTSLKFFQLMVSEDPSTHEDEEQFEGVSIHDDEDPPRKKQHRVCPGCELAWRISVKYLHDIGKVDADWATLARVRKDMKQANKGRQKVFRGMHYRIACRITENSSGYRQLSKKDRANAKTQKCKNLTDAFVAVIQRGQLFSVFSNAGRRINISTDLDSKVDKLFDAYIADPENVAKLKALEAVEMEVAQAIEYKTAGGDVEILKELDHHNDICPDEDCGLQCFDVCRAGVAISLVQTLMQVSNSHHVLRFIMLFMSLQA